MREVKRKRPWETQQEEFDTNPFNTLIYQLILSTFIAIGIFAMLNTDNHTHIKEFINTQLTKNIELQDFRSLIEYMKDTLHTYTDTF